VPHGKPRGTPDAGEAESGYWDLVHILYPELLERMGAGLLREVVPSWPRLERTLEVPPPPPTYS